MHPELDLRLILPKDKYKMNVLNVGIGDGHSALARQLPYLKFKSLTLLDVENKYIEDAKKISWKSEAKYINKSITEQEDFNYDLILFFDILEHLKKEDALKVLEKVKDKNVIVFIPLEKKFRNNVFDVKSQDHLSLWTEEDFNKLGYKTKVIKDFHLQEGEVFDTLWAFKISKD
jgi:2-polyprenyl-3-methyl-5-hydroxy-6-metoxy-1,4-benzoquinol methylase